jgi:hypothetical protein
VMELPFHFVRTRAFAENVESTEASESSEDFAYAVYSRRRRRSSLVSDVDRPPTPPVRELNKDKYGSIVSRARLSYLIVYALMGILLSGSLVALTCLRLDMPFLGLTRDMTGVVALVLCGLSVEMFAGVVWLRLNIQDAIATGNGGT